MVNSLEPAARRVWSFVTARDVMGEVNRVRSLLAVPWGEGREGGRE